MPRESKQKRNTPFKLKWRVNVLPHPGIGHMKFASVLRLRWLASAVACVVTFWRGTETGAAVCTVVFPFASVPMTCTDTPPLLLVVVWKRRGLLSVHVHSHAHAQPVGQRLIHVRTRAGMRRGIRAHGQARALARHTARVPVPAAPRTPMRADAARVHRPQAQSARHAYAQVPKVAHTTCRVSRNAVSQVQETR